MFGAGGSRHRATLHGVEGRRQFRPASDRPSGSVTSRSRRTTAPVVRFYRDLGLRRARARRRRIAELEMRGGTHLVLVLDPMPEGRSRRSISWPTTSTRSTTHGATASRSRDRARPRSFTSATPTAVVTVNDSHVTAGLAGVAVEDAGEPLGVLAERAVRARRADLVAHARITCWMWMFHGSTLSSSSTLCSSDRRARRASDRGPTRMRVAEAAHAEREQRLDRPRCVVAGTSCDGGVRAPSAPRASRPRDGGCGRRRSTSGSPAPMTSSTAWLPTHRSPLARSKHRKCVQQSSQLIGAQRKKICGSVISGAAGVGRADRAHAPRTVLGAVHAIDRDVAARRRRCGPTTFPTASCASSP